jgi:hypothetical protein
VAYVLPVPAGSTLTDADLILGETATGPRSEVVRFTHVGPSLIPVLVFFSDSTPGDPAPALVDIGFPTPLLTQYYWRVLKVARKAMTAFFTHPRRPNQAS